jgi:hypothetical protein
MMMRVTCMQVASTTLRQLQTRQHAALALHLQQPQGGATLQCLRCQRSTCTFAQVSTADKLNVMMVVQCLVCTHQQLQRPECVCQSSAE